MGTGRRGKRKEESKTNPSLDLPRWPNSKEFICQCRRLSFDPWLGKIPGEGLATCSSILAWELHVQRSLVGHSPWARKRVEHDLDLATKQ